MGGVGKEIEGKGDVKGNGGDGKGDVGKGMKWKGKDGKGDVGKGMEGKGEDEKGEVGKGMAGKGGVKSKGVDGTGGLDDGGKGVNTTSRVIEDQRAVFETEVRVASWTDLRRIM